MCRPIDGKYRQKAVFGEIKYKIRMKTLCRCTRFFILWCAGRRKLLQKGERLMNYYYMAMRGSLVVGLNTDLDHHLADEVRQVIDEVVEERGIRSIIFDFSKVAFMDSSGIGLIMGRYKKMHQNGRIAIVAPCKSVERILQISGLHKLVTVFDDIGEALDSCEIHDDSIAAEKGGKRGVKY